MDRRELIELKKGQLVSVLLPARNEEKTIGGILEIIKKELAGPIGLIDEIIVIDDGSTDSTFEISRTWTKNTYKAGDILSDQIGPGPGKGEALLRALYKSSGDILVFLDADVRNFSTDFIIKLLYPLLSEPQKIKLVKGYYERFLDRTTTLGGRVTELVAKPILNVLYPALSIIKQPLAGETASKRQVLENLNFAPGYGVEIGLLIDVYEKYGIDSIAQVDLGVRQHRNRDLLELSGQAKEVIRTALSKRAPQLLTENIYDSSTYFSNCPSLAEINQITGKH
jgi:glucosyl-3-phosphoglycerate synthase